MNTNKLIKQYKGATGLKTGTTNDAGKCLSATANRENLQLTAVVLGLKTSDERFASAKQLLDYGFGTYAFIKPTPIEDQLIPMKVKHGVEPMVELYAEYPEGYVLEKNKQDQIETKLTVQTDIQAPLYKGQKVGKVSVLLGDEVLGEYDICTKADVQQMTFTKALEILCKELVTNNNNRT